MTVEVTEADREFAARLDGYDDGESGFKRYLAGDFDAAVGVQMAARFRLEERERCAKIAEAAFVDDLPFPEIAIAERIRAGSTGDKG